MKRRTKWPSFKSLDEEADYWEKHSISPYWQIMEDAPIDISSSLDNWLVIQMNPADIHKLNRAAHKKKKTIQKLAWQWIQSLAS